MVGNLTIALVNLTRVSGKEAQVVEATIHQVRAGPPGCTCPLASRHTNLSFHHLLMCTTPYQFKHCVLSAQHKLPALQVRSYPFLDFQEALRFF